MKDLFTPEQIAVHPNVTMVNDALSLDHLSHLRDEPNRHKELGKYRGHTDALNDMLINAAVADLPMYRSKVTNGLIQDMGAESYIAPKLAKNVIAIQILRAGQSMATSALKILPESALGSAGLYRDEEAQPHWYLWKMPKTDENTIILLLDPMLATAGSALEVRDRIEAEGIKYKEIRQVHQVGAPEGIVKILSRYPETKFYLAAQDSHLDGNSYIRPGLGDAGDNYFGTPHH